MTLLEQVELDVMVLYHLRYNHVPAAPSYCVPLAVAIIKEMRAGVSWEEIEVEVAWLGGTVGLPKGEAPAFIEAWHLDVFVDGEEDDDGE